MGWHRKRGLVFHFRGPHFRTTWNYLVNVGKNTKIPMTLVATCKMCTLVQKVIFYSTNLTNQSSWPHTAGEHWNACVMYVPCASSVCVLCVFCVWGNSGSFSVIWPCWCSVVCYRVSLLLCIVNTHCDCQSLVRYEVVCKVSFPRHICSRPK